MDRRDYLLHYRLVARWLCIFKDATSKRGRTRRFLAFRRAACLSPLRSLAVFLRVSSTSDFVFFASFFARARAEGELDGAWKKYVPRRFLFDQFLFIMTLAMSPLSLIGSCVFILLIFLFFRVTPCAKFVDASINQPAPVATKAPCQDHLHRFCFLLSAGRRKWAVSFRGVPPAFFRSFVRFFFSRVVKPRLFHPRKRACHSEPRPSLSIRVFFLGFLFFFCFHASEEHCLTTSRGKGGMK